MSVGKQAYNTVEITITQSTNSLKIASIFPYHSDIVLNSSLFF